MIIVADGLLNYIPFETLILGAGGETMLDKYAISYTPSLSTLKLLRARALRQAKLRIRGDRRWRHPFFWSGFILQDDH